MSTVKQTGRQTDKYRCENTNLLGGGNKEKLDTLSFWPAVENATTVSK